MRDMYKYVTDENQNWQCIGITKGRYQGVIYKYGKVSVPNPEDIQKSLTTEGNLPFRFEYDILKTFERSIKRLSAAAFPATDEVYRCDIGSDIHAPPPP